MAAFGAKSRRSCATRSSRSRTGASIRISASIRSASSARSSSACSAASGRRAARPSPSSSPATSSSTNDRSFIRKVREAILAMALEWRFSKDQILELYLNRVYFGGGAFGIDAASRRFFGHSATQLSTGEAAMIAGLVKAPSNYAPTAEAAAARGRQRARIVLGEMVEYGAITPAAGGGGQSGRRSRSRDNTHGRHPDPLFHRLGDAAARHADRRDGAADRRLDHRPSRHAGGRRTGDLRQCAARACRARWSASTATARSGRWSAGSTIAPPATTARPRRAPARLLVQAVRLSRRAGGGTDPGHADPRRADHDRPLVAAQFQRPLCRADPDAPGAGLFGQHRRRPDRPAGRHPDRRRHGAAARHHDAASRPCRRWRWAPPRCG